MVEANTRTTLDPVTFEVLKNSFATIVDQMAEQILRTCHSFVLYARDFSNALCDAEGNTVMQGSQDIAVHVGTLHLTARAVIDAYGDRIAEGDVYAINDPYRGGTHFADVRIVRPIFSDGELLGFAQSNGHWTDVGGSVPGSFDTTAREHFGEGLRIPPVRIWHKGEYQDDVVRLLVSNMRSPGISEGDLHAQAQATQVAEREIHRLVSKYGNDVVCEAFSGVQDYVERLASRRVAELPDGTWETEDYLDFDPARGEALVPVRVKMTIEEDRIRYDCSGSHPAVGTILNATYGSSFSGLVTGTKMFFPDLPLNSGFYRVIDVNLGEEGSVVNAIWPTAVTGFCSGAYEKIVNAVFELWSQVVPERAIACCFNLEYLLVGGRDERDPNRPIYMYHDWMVGGWGARNGRDGSNATSAVFGVGEETQPLEGQERLSPVLTTSHQILIDSGGPGEFRGGCGVLKGARIGEASQTVMSYCSDRARSITWGINGGLPSMPQGVTLTRDADPEGTYLGAAFSNVALASGDQLSRPSAGGGGYGDPLDRNPQMVLEDVIDGYVSIERALTDYGVSIREIDAEILDFEIQRAETEVARERIRAERAAWLTRDPEEVAEAFRVGELTVLDVVRRYAVILDWQTGLLLPTTTATFRAAVQRRSADHWPAPTGSHRAEAANV